MKRPKLTPFEKLKLAIERELANTDERALKAAEDRITLMQISSCTPKEKPHE